MSVSLQDLVLQNELNQDDPAELAAWNQPQMQGAHFETLIIYKLSARKFTTQNDLYL